MNEEVLNEIKRLRFEDFLWVIFIILSLANIVGDRNEVEYLETNNINSHNRSNEIFEITLSVSLIIYIYFFLRNYNAYQKASIEQKNLFLIKILGSTLLIAGIICLLYFQKNQSSFAGSPAI